MIGRLEGPANGRSLRLARRDDREVMTEKRPEISRAELIRRAGAATPNVGMCRNLVGSAHEVAG